MHVLPADQVAPHTGCVATTTSSVLTLAAAGSFARTALDPAELLHVDVDELARP